MAYDVAASANRIMGSLLSGESFTIPDVDVSAVKLPVFPQPDFTAPKRLTNEDLTQKQKNGNGTFDFLVQALLVHIQSEYDAGRITGADYAKVYLGVIEGAMQNATAFLLGKDQAYWSAVQAQQAAKLTTAQLTTAQIELEKAKIELAMAKSQARNQQAEYALTKAKLATEEAAFGTAQYNLEQMLPQQKLNLMTQETVLKAQERQVVAETAKSGSEKLLIEANKSNTDAQRSVIQQQEEFIKEQTESQRAQTLDTRRDGSAVRGALGKQKELHAQQIISYQRDAEVKAARMFVDAWITQKTIDEGLVPPNGFTNASLDNVLSKLRSNNGF